MFLLLTHSPLPVLTVFVLHVLWRHVGAVLPECQIEKTQLYTTVILMVPLFEDLFLKCHRIQICSFIGWVLLVDDQECNLVWIRHLRCKGAQRSRPNRIILIWQSLSSYIRPSTFTPFYFVCVYSICQINSIWCYISLWMLRNDEQIGGLNDGVLCSGWICRRNGLVLLNMGPGTFCNRGCLLFQGVSRLRTYRDGCGKFIWAPREGM